MKRLIFGGCLMLLSCMLNAASEDVDSAWVDQQAQLAMSLETTNKDSALKVATALLNYSLDHVYARGEALARVRLATLNFLEGKHQEALDAYDLALHIREQNANYIGQVDIQIARSYVYQQMGVLDSALATLITADRIAQNQSLADQSASILVEMANIYMDYGDLDQARQTLLRAEQKAAATDDAFGLIYIRFAWADYYYQTDSVQNALNQYLAINEELMDGSNDFLRLQNWNNIASCYQELGDYKVAIAYYRIIIEELKAIKNSNDLALAKFNLGASYYNIDEYDSALLALRESAFIARVIGDTYREMRAEEYMIEVYNMLNQEENALQHFYLYDSLKSTLLDEEKIRSMSEMQTRYETQLKEQAIALLDEENKSKTAQRNALLIGLVLLVVVGTALIFFFIQKNKLAKQEQLIAEQKLDGVLDEQEIKTYNAMLKGQEEERLRIANDLHDRLGSMLSTIKLMFSSLEDKIGQVQAENKSQLEKTTHLIDDACVEVRRISHNLGAGLIANYGLVHSLEDLIETINQTAKVECRLLVYHMEEGLPLRYEVELYRIAQEVLNNALKYADAKKITVQLSRLDEEFSMTIEDDGKGFDYAKAKKKGGMGLSNIEKRAAKLNGKVFIDTAINKGCITIIEIPLKAR